MHLIENKHWRAFHHPQPDYPLHIVILPKGSLTNLLDAPDGEEDFYVDLFQLVRTLIYDFRLGERGYRLITNGGPNQTIPQWHWHLVSDHPGDTDA